MGTRTADLDFDSTYEIHNLAGLTLAGTGWMPFLRNATAPGTSMDLTGLVAYWTLDEVSGNRADSVGANTLTDTNTVTSNPGKIGTSAQFTPANSEKLTIADNAALSTGDIDFTIAGWVYLDSVTGVHDIFGKWTESGNQREFVLLHSSNKFTWYVSTNGSAIASVQSSVTVSSTGTWYFVAVWHDATNNQIGIRVNTTDTTAAHSGGVFNSTAPFNLGTRENSALYYFAGRLDEVGFWKRMLTGAELTYLYNGGSGLTYPFTTGGDQSLYENLNANGKTIYNNRLRYTSVTSAYQVTGFDEVLLCNGTFTVTLPTATGIGGKMYQIKNVGTGLVTVDGFGSETIDGATTVGVATKSNLVIMSDGTNWVIL